MSDAPLEVPWDDGVPAAWSLAGVLALVHVGTGLQQWWVGYEPLWRALFWDRSVRFRVDVGGQLDLLVDQGELWRLATSVLLHGDALHLTLNAVALVVLGRMLEPWVGAGRWLGWFAVGGLAGSLTSHLVGLHQSDGASGGAFALLGAALVIGLRLRSRLDPEARRLYGWVLWAFLGLNLVLSLALPFVDAVGHGGGLAAGLILGALASRPDGSPVPAWRSAVWWAVVTGFCGLCAWGWLQTSL